MNPLRLVRLIQRTGRVAEPAPPVPTDVVEPTAELMTALRLVPGVGYIYEDDYLRK